MTSSATPPEIILAAGIAARILHDISGPASGVASGLELLAESGQGDIAGAALDLAVSSAKSLLDLLEFDKSAFGPIAEAVDGATLRRLALTPFNGRRPGLEWTSAIDPLPGPAAQAMLILAQIAAATLAAGGLARATAFRAASGIVVEVDGEGPRAALHPETLAGLEGRAFSAGLSGRWAPSRYLNAVVTAAGGALTVTVAGERFSLTATFPLNDCA